MHMDTIRKGSYEISPSRNPALLQHHMSAVVPAHAGTHIPEAGVHGSRFRGDDNNGAVGMRPYKNSFGISVHFSRPR